MTTRFQTGSAARGTTSARAGLRWLALWVLASTSCGVLPADIIEGTTTTSTSASGSTGGGVSSTTNSTGSVDDSTGGGSSSDGPVPCNVEGCPCQPGECAPGLGCIDDVCVDQCGNGVIDPGEECEEDEGLDDHDGCTSQCLFSPRAEQVAAGDDHTCALFHDGLLMCWGRGEDGRLGYGNDANVGDDEHPVSVGFVDLGQSATEVGLGQHHGCALRTDGSVICWGRNGVNGPLGQGSTLPAVEDIGDDDHPSEYPAVDIGMTAKAISVGTNHACAIGQNDRVTCWGRGLHGRLGYGNESNIGDDEVPAMAGEVQTGADVLQIAAGGTHTCALLVGNAIRCWGEGTNGQLGYPDTVNVGATDLPDAHGPVELGAGETPILIRAGRDHTCILLDDNRIRCWGLGAQGRLGYGDEQDVGNSSPITDRTPLVVGNGAEIVDLALGVAHTCAVTGTGGVYCWGAGGTGALGQGSSTHLYAPPGDPVMLGDDRMATQVTGGNGHTCVRLADSHAMCWGRGDYGKLGYGNLDDIGGSSGVPAKFGTIMLE